jgi:hypothetical protein
MKCLTDAEIGTLFANPDALTNEASVLAAARALVAAADRLGLVLTVEQWSIPPLAMGNYRTEVSVRSARARS